MKKIVITGIVASGKTTLARRLSERLEIPWYELDCIVHYRTSNERVKRTPQEQMRVIKEIDKQGPWIFEGTDRGSYQSLYDMADTIIFLDPPLWKRKIRIITRYLKHQIGIEQPHYKSDLNMLKMMFQWTKDFERNRSEFEAKLKLYKDKVIRLTDNNNLEFIYDDEGG
ncbi:AAA family ATPase [Paenibacillus motobuensis]|uniref:AAA family ATPase n=1 Tax=Paenibacillus motobuensis TaxID=295324 RepID=A0ABP3I0M9_9BACL